ncbi:MAG: hypothetical protein LBJ91_02630 [Clostridiales Family XIII bacterium]|jgi:hypothetical protein|nr:hypothetical protein [Clostridiales Family XIII bacterium]
MSEADKKAEKKPEPKAAEAKYTVAQIVASQRYKPQRDIITAILDKDKEYTLGDVDRRVKAYLERKVV